ncbi:MAG: hypothetical protein AABW58_04695 [Nanoarchaeota archaeon]
MKRRSEYVFGALTLATFLCIGASAIKSNNYFETNRVTRIRTQIRDHNGNAVITQISSYTPIDTDKDGKYDAVDVKKETLDNSGKVITSKEEKGKRLEDLTEQELELLKLKK